MTVFNFFELFGFGITLSGGITSISESELKLGGWFNRFKATLRFTFPE